MDARQVWQVLERGGLKVGAATGGPGAQARPVELRFVKYNGLADPAGAEVLGRRLAERARPLKPSVVLLWEDAEDVVLGHIIGRELSVPVVRSYDADGLVGYTGPLPPSSRVLLVADAFCDATLIHAMRALAEQQGGTVVGTAVLVDTDALAAAGEAAGTVVSLVSTREEVAGTVASKDGDGTR